MNSRRTERLLVRVATMRLCAAVLALCAIVLVGWVYWIVNIFNLTGPLGIANWRIYVPLPIGVLAIQTGHSGEMLGMVGEVVGLHCSGPAPVSKE